MKKTDNRGMSKLSIIVMLAVLAVAGIIVAVVMGKDKDAGRSPEMPVASQAPSQMPSQTPSVTAVPSPSPSPTPLIRISYRDDAVVVDDNGNMLEYGYGTMTPEDAGELISWGVDRSLLEDKGVVLDPVPTPVPPLKEGDILTKDDGNGNEIFVGEVGSDDELKGMKRKLKVYACSQLGQNTPWQVSTYKKIPRIILQGDWLKDAGYEISDSVIVTC